MSDNLSCPDLSFSASCAVLVHNARAQIADWIAWHLSLGFQRILVIDSFSDDGTEKIVRAVENTCPVEWHAPFRDETSYDAPSDEAHRLHLTRYALEQLRRHKPGTRKTPHWLCVLDADEYLEPDPDLKTLLRRGGKAAAISLNWCIFGSSGHRKPPKGHIVATHQWRADRALAEHHMTRLLIRADHLPAPENITDPLSCNIAPKKIIHASGKPLETRQAEKGVSWAGGRILHYIVPDRYGSARNDDKTRGNGTIPPYILKNHFDRNDVRDIGPQQHLPQMRLLQNTLWQHSFDYGLKRLRDWAANYVRMAAHPVPDADFALADFVEREGLSYRRCRPARKNSLLLSPQAAPPYGLCQSFTLHNAATGTVLMSDNIADAPSSPPLPLIGLVQNAHPRLLSLFRPDQQDFVLGDIPCLYGMAAILTKPTYRTRFFSLPEESGQAGLLFEARPCHAPFPTGILPLPQPDDSTGLSLDTVMIWIGQHSDAGPHDFYRLLRLLGQNACALIGKGVPELAPFLTRDCHA